MAHDDKEDQTENFASAVEYPGRAKKVVVPERLRQPGEAVTFATCGPVDTRQSPDRSPQGKHIGIDEIGTAPQSRTFAG